MIFDPDHMSVLARNQALDLVEEHRLPRGVLVAQLVDRGRAAADLQARRHRHARTPATPRASSTSGSTCGRCSEKLGRQYFGVGYGADANGFGSQGSPRASAAENPARLPVQVLRRQGDARPAGLGRAGLRPERGRRRPLRPLSGLDRGPARAGGQADHPRHGPWRRGVPADVGARLRGPRGPLRRLERARADQRGLARRIGLGARRGGCSTRGPAGEAQADLALVRGRREAEVVAGFGGGRVEFVLERPRATPGRSPAAPRRSRDGRLGRRRRVYVVDGGRVTHAGAASSALLADPAAARAQAEARRALSGDPRRASPSGPPSGPPR